MLSELPFGSLLVYSPRGQLAVSEQSRVVCAAIKNARPIVLRRFTEVLAEHLSSTGPLSKFFQKDTTLIPMPRSAPLYEGALWPARKICECVIAAGVNGEILPAVRRVTAVPKSSRAQPGHRPLIAAHVESMIADRIVGVTPHIVLVDDVVTKGSTAFAAASQLTEAYPNARIRLFAAIRTKGMQPDIEQIIEPCVGTITNLLGAGNRDP